MNIDSDAESIQRRMKEVRHELDDDVQEIAEGVRELGDWRSYVKTYPWICLGTAAILGYMVIPRSRKHLTSNFSFPDQETQPDRFTVLSQPQPVASGLNIAMSFLGNALLQGISSYIGNRTARFLESHAEEPEESAPT